VILFGHYRLDRVQGLRRGDAEVRVTPKSLAVLSVLAERAGQVVTKEELFRAAWPDAAVSDAALTSCIQELRQALEDDPRRPRYIETMHRRGYRFLAPVEQAVAHNENSDATPVAGHPHFHRWRLLGAGLLILIAPAILGSTLLRRDLPPAAPASLLVLPFQSLDAGPMDNRLGEGISEQLTAKLMSLPGLRLVSPEAAYRVHAATADPAEAGRRLNAEAVLVGSVRTADRKVRVNAQLIRTIDRRVLWAEGGLELEARDLLEAESVLATAIATRLRGSLTPRERTELARAPTSDAEAYELFVRGRLALRAARDGDEFRIAEQLFEQALQRDPDFGQALAWLALTQARSFMLGRAGDDTRKVSIENARRRWSSIPRRRWPGAR
jgi:DNA-binding winged helix-turn-helix (wHTH) protein/TolB-like protein